MQPSIGDPLIPSSVIRSPKDFLAGLMFVVIGLAAVFLARDLAFGSAVKMKEGYFPTIMGGLLAIIGLICIIRSLSLKGEVLEKVAFKPLILVCVSTVLFGLMLRNAGMVFAIAFLIFMSAYASVKFRWVVAFNMFMIMALFCYLVFIRGLGLSMPLLGKWLTFT
jgi:Tripartite tricarboxylate transporter TctB family